jgi:D-glycero-D-manno-heptose 1,7-bisphosphate phosphatase
LKVIRSSSRTSRAVFLDRDGVLNARPPEHEYVTSVDEFEWLPGAREAVVQLKRGGWTVAVVSNQRGVALGIVSTETLREIERRIQGDLAPDTEIDLFSYCPHDLDEGCDCRKPQPGLIMRAAGDLGVRLAGSWMIGDAESDVSAGRAAGCSTVLLSPEAPDTAADLVKPDLAAAARSLC